MESLPPELLLEIAKYLPFYSGQILRVKTSDQRLLSIPRGRRQIYASAIQIFTVTSHHVHEHEELGELEFASLQNLLVPFTLYAPGTSFPYSCLVGYMVPSLRAVWLGSGVNGSILNALATLCHRLRCISLNLDAFHMTEDSTLDFLSKCSSLEDINLYCSSASTLSPRILRKLAVYKNLRELHIAEPKQDTIEAADLKSIPQPFSSLQRLEIDTSPERASVLIPSVRGIRELSLAFGRFAPELTFTGRTLRILSSHLRELRCLDITFFASVRIPPDDIVYLRELTQLRQLNLLTRRQAEIEIPGFDDTHFQALISELVGLRGLSLSCTRRRLATACLIALAESCPLLYSCMVSSLEVNPLELQACRAPLFPNMEELSFSGFVPEPGNDEAPTAYLKCRGLDIPADMQKFTKAVEKAWARNRRAQGKRIRTLRQRIVAWA
ncbi:hypothetical protein BDV12DRAFT_208424 [Aspergillus spectabilis]